MSEKEIKFRTFGFEFKEVSEDGIIRGYASTFGNMDLGFDIVDKGAFKKTLKENMHVPVLADHDPTKQVGWNLSASEDNTGLAVEADLDIKNVQLAKERYSLARKALELGAKAGISIGYSTIKAEPDSKNPSVRRLKELKLWEYSLVTFPMNTEAMVTAAKSFGCIDKARLLITQLSEYGISKADLEIALQAEAADKSFDATKFSQSMDALIEKFRN